MSKSSVMFVMVSLLFFVLSCAPTAQVLVKEGPSIAEAQAEPADGEKLRIAVMGFENKTRYDVGRGMEAMLTTSLFSTNKFIVIERKELQGVLLEQQLGGTGVVSPDTATPVGEIEGAQVQIYGTVTDFEPGHRGASTLFGGAQQSHVAIDMKLVDARTSRILATTTVEGKATDINLNTKMLKYAGVSPLYSLEIWINTPVGSAIRLCIDKAVDYIVTKLE